MQEAQNTRIVQDAYAAFGRGDIQALLGYMTDDITWQPVIGTAAHVPFAGRRQGKAAVAEFFRIVSETEDFQRFELREFIAQGDTVVAIGHYTAKTRSTGKIFDAEFVMVFTVTNGRVCAFREFTDSAQINAAFAVGATV